MKNRHWFNFVEDFSLLGLGAGLSLSFISKQILYTSAPLSFALLIGILNRRRIEQAQDQKLSDSLATLDQKFSTNLEAIDRQVKSMPTPEMVGDVRQSILQHSREKTKKTYAYIHTIKQDVEKRLRALDPQKLDEACDDITQLQMQFAEVYKSLNGITHSLPQLVTNDQAQKLEQTISDISVDTNKLDAEIKKLNEFSSHTLTNLQDQVSQLNRQIKALPPQVDTSSIKREVGELVRVVADLVPKRDLNALVADLRVVQQQQTSQIQAEEALRRDMQKVNKRLQSLPDVPQLRSQLEESFTREIRAINRQLRTLYHSPELKSTIEDVLRSEVQHLREMIADRTPSLPYDLVFDLSPEADSDAEPIIPGSRKALIDALESTQKRLIVIWPWSIHTELDAEMLRRIEGFLKQQRQLDIGWCHVSDRQDDRFLSVINRRWSINPLAGGSLQGTLKRLLAIKRYYPHNFQFKILGTAENYLISDDTFAILGLDARLKTQTSLQDAELKLRTTDEQIVQHLTQRFDEANPPAHDIDAYWNRAVTRYDLGDKAGAATDIETLLASVPDDPAAYNLRGIIRYEQKNLDAALEDLTRSIALKPDQCSAYCNRGYLQSERGDQYGAIADFSLAIQHAPTSAIAYFYRGAASQKLEDYDGAIADYSEALTHAPHTPAVFYQRAMVYQAIASYELAIADLEQAAQYFEEQNSPVNAQKAQQTLLKVQQLAIDAPSLDAQPPVNEPLNLQSDDFEDGEGGTSGAHGSDEAEPLVSEPVHDDAQLGDPAATNGSPENEESPWIHDNFGTASQSAQGVIDNTREETVYEEETISSNEGGLISEQTKPLHEEAIALFEDTELASENATDSADVMKSLTSRDTDSKSEDELAFPDEEADRVESLGTEKTAQFDSLQPADEPIEESLGESLGAIAEFMESGSLSRADAEIDEEAFDESSIETLDLEPHLESQMLNAQPHVELNVEPNTDQFSELELFEDFDSVSNAKNDTANARLNLADHSVDSIMWDAHETDESDTMFDYWVDEPDVNAPPTHQTTSTHAVFIDPESTYVQDEGTTPSLGTDLSTDATPENRPVSSNTTIVPSAILQEDAEDLSSLDSSRSEESSLTNDHSVDSIVWEVDEDSDATTSADADTLSAMFSEPKALTLESERDPAEHPGNFQSSAGVDSARANAEAASDNVDQLFDVWDEDTPENTPLSSSRESQLPSQPPEQTDVTRDEEDPPVHGLPPESASETTSPNSPERWGDFFDSFGVESSFQQNAEKSQRAEESMAGSTNEKDEVDTQQIGAQTLQDFFSVINSERNDRDTDLFSENEAWHTPEQSDPEEQGDSAQSNPVESQPAQRSDRSHQGNTRGDRYRQTSTPSSQFQDDRFLRFSTQENVKSSVHNGNNLSVADTARVYTDELSESPSDESPSQSLDEDSLADFCKRFTI